MKSNYDLLDRKDILSILDGDEKFGDCIIDGEKINISYSMPYLSGPTLCDISTKFGLPVFYGWNGGAQSRWMYLSDLLKFCIREEKVSDLLSYLFDREQFKDILKGLPASIIEKAHQQIVSMAIERINENLYFGKHELVEISGKYYVQKIDSVVKVAAPSVKTINRSYISEISSRAIKDIEEKNFDSAVTKSRTLLEEVFCYVIEKKGQPSPTSGDISKLYNKVKELYGMRQSGEADKRVNALLSGLEKILMAISEMRNIGSDSHGLGNRRISISDHHARLFVNSSMVMAEFILAVSEKQQAKLN